MNSSAFFFAGHCPLDAAWMHLDTQLFVYQPSHLAGLQGRAAALVRLDDLHDFWGEFVGGLGATSLRQQSGNPVALER